MYRRVSSERNRDDQSVVNLQEQREALQKLAEDEGYETVGGVLRRRRKREGADRVTVDAIGEQPAFKPRCRLEAQVLRMEPRGIRPDTGGAGG